MPGRSERLKKRQRQTQKFRILSDVGSGEESDEEDFRPVRQGQLTKAEQRREQEAREAARAGTELGKPSRSSAHDKENEEPAQKGNGRQYRGTIYDSIPTTMDGHLQWGTRPKPAVVVKKTTVPVASRRTLPVSRQQAGAEVQPATSMAGGVQPAPVAGMAPPGGRVPYIATQRALKQEATADSSVAATVEDGDQVTAQISQTGPRKEQLLKKTHVQPVLRKKSEDPSHKLIAPPAEPTVAKNDPSMVEKQNNFEKANQEGLTKRKHTIEDPTEAKGHGPLKDNEPPKKKTQMAPHTGVVKPNRSQSATSSSNQSTSISELSSSPHTLVVVEDDQQSLVLPSVHVNLNDLAAVQKEIARAQAVRSALPLRKALTAQGEKTSFLTSLDLQLDWLTKMCALLKKRPSSIKSDSTFFAPTAAAKAMFSGVQNLHKKLAHSGDGRALRLLNKQLKASAEDVALMIEDRESKAAALSGELRKDKESVVNALKFEREALLAIQAGTQVFVDEDNSQPQSGGGLG